MLFLMVVPCSIIGPLTIGLPAKDTYVKAIWRIQGWAIANFIMITIIYLISPSSYSFKKEFSWSNLKSTAVLGFFLITWATGYILGWSLTITSHADIMYSSSWVWIFIGTILTWGVIDKFEVYGYFFYLIGVAFMFSDQSASKTWSDGQSYKGDLFAFLGAGSWAIFTYLNKKIKLCIDPITKSAQCYMFSMIFQFAMFPFLTSSDKFFSFDPELGAFGWMYDWDSFVLVFLINAPITGIIGNIGFFMRLSTSQCKLYQEQCCLNHL